MAMPRTILVGLAILLAALGGRRKDAARPQDSPGQKALGVLAAKPVRRPTPLTLTSRFEGQAISPDMAAIEESEETEGDHYALSFASETERLSIPSVSRSYEALPLSAHTASRPLRLRC